MKPQTPANKLEKFARSIQDSLDGSGVLAAGEYEYSASYVVPKSRQILGDWEVIEHTVSGQPYLESWVCAKYPDAEPSDFAYDGRYTFSERHCVKRVRIAGSVDGSISEYRISLVLDWSIKGNVLYAKPIHGYQCASIDDVPSAVQEMPPDSPEIALSIRCEEDILVITDGDDVKRLRRIR